MKPIRCIFFGTPHFSVPSLKALAASPSYTIVSVVTQPDKPKGRSGTPVPSPVSRAAESLNIPVLKPKTMTELGKPLTEYSPIDAYVVVAYGKIIPRSLISAPRLSTINAHPSLLPALRGPSPIQTALLQNLTETGVSIILLDEEVDHGPLLAQLPVAILPRDTYVTLLEKLSVSAAKLIAETIIAYANGVIQPIPQNHSAATYTKRFTKRDGVIPWKNPAQTILNRIRALNPWPGTATMWNGKNLAVLEAELFSGGVSLPPGDVSFAKDKLLVGTGTVPLMVKTLRLAGKKTLDAQSFMRGHPSFLKAHLPS